MTKQSRRRLLTCLALLMLAAALLPFSGCSYDQAGPTTSRADATKDPFGYKPDFSDTDISGGKINNLDRRGLKKDMDNVFNP